MNLVINLDKPKGMTSQEAVTAVKRAFHLKKAGHAGTLDPIATGVLLICLNEATKIARFLTDLDKEYIARIRLGVKTDTLDSEGKVIERTEGFSFSEEEIIPLIKRFEGEIEQIPPMYSAIKVGGEPLYKLARKGITVERKKRRVHIYRIDLLNLDTGVPDPFLDISVRCSKGTYIRTLCSDIGDALGVGGHVIELRRIATGRFRVDDSITLDRLKGYPLEKITGEKGPSSPVMTIDAALNEMEEVILGDEDMKRAKNGLPLKLRKNLYISSGYIKLKDPGGRLFGIGRLDRGIIKIERILHL